MKKKWEYKYPERLVQAMVSEDHVLIGDRLYFVHMTNGSYPKAGIYCVDVNSGEAEAVFETCDFLRTVGVYRDGCFYFTSLRGNAYCVTTEGELKWTKLLGEKNGAADWNVVLDEDGLFMAQDALYCLDSENGEVMWANGERAHGSNCTILAEDGLIYHAKSGGHIYCCDKYNGKTLWTYGEEEWCRGAAIVDSRAVLYISSHGKYMFLDKKTGRLLREEKIDGKLMRSPVTQGGRIFSGENAGSTGGRMMCYEIGDNYEMKPAFEVPASGAITTQAVIAGETMCFGTEDGSVYFVNSVTGEEIEKKKKVKGACRGIAVCGGGIVALSDKGPAVGMQ